MVNDLVHRAAPQLLEPFGIGVDTAAEILVVVGDNPERIKSEAVLAKLAGSARADCSRTYTVGHRGAPEMAPENTIAALEVAADAGAEWVETDVQFTKDGRPVLRRDDTVDRMTDGKGRIDQLIAKEIAELTVKGGGRVPTLEQVLFSLKGRSARPPTNSDQLRWPPLDDNRCPRPRGSPRSWGTGYRRLNHR